MPASVVVDTNVVVRFLTGDDPEQAAAATGLFRAAGKDLVNVLIPTSVLQETVYVLETYYEGTPATIAPGLLSLLALPGINCPDSAWVAEAVHWYRRKNSDFGDALVCAFAQHHGCAVSTFDKDLIKRFSEISAAPPERR